MGILKTTVQALSKQARGYPKLQSCCFNTNGYLNHGKIYHTKKGNLLINNIVAALTKKVGAAKAFNENVDRSFLIDMLPKTQDELPKRTMADSYDEAIIPLSTNERLREKYITYMGGVRVGRLLEDLDVFAVWLCYNHVLNPHQKPDLPSPYSIVTGMVDRIDFDAERKLQADQDIKLAGCVTWAGRTSLEAVISLKQKVDGEWEQLTTAVFVMVARDPLNKGAAIINPLVATNEKEEEMLRQGEINKITRKQLQEESLFNTPPNESEKSLVHNMFMEMADPKQLSFSPKHQPENSVWMEETKLKNLIICHPESRNIFNKIFGGFLMRQAFQLSWTNASVFSKKRPYIIHIDDIMFKSPVEIGSLLYLSSQVVYTEGNHMQISTKASVMDVATGTSKLTNIFHFTFEVDSPLPKCIPRSYHEAMMFLDGRRHYLMARKGRKFYGQGEIESDTSL